MGGNNRNLGSFVTDVENSFRIARQLREATHGPASPLLVSESGISDPETICRLRAAGFRGFLIGETFMKTANPGETLKKFIQDSLLINNRKLKVDNCKYKSLSYSVTSRSQIVNRKL